VEFSNGKVSQEIKQLWNIVCEALKDNARR